MNQNVTVNFDQEKLEDGTGSGNDDELTALKDSRNGTARIRNARKFRHFSSITSSTILYIKKLLDCGNVSLFSIESKEMGKVNARLP